MTGDPESVLERLRLDRPSDRPVDKDRDLFDPAFDGPADGDLLRFVPISSGDRHVCTTGETERDTDRLLADSAGERTTGDGRSCIGETGREDDRLRPDPAGERTGEDPS